MTIVGDVPYQDEYAVKIKKVANDRILFTGYINDQDELAELYHNCFAYIHGHQFGGTNPAMLKAMAYGCAVLALDTVFAREMCDNEKHALYFSKQEYSLKNLIHHIKRNHNLLEKMSKTSRERILENYTWEKITDQYLELFKKLVKN